MAKKDRQDRADGRDAEAVSRSRAERQGVPRRPQGGARPRGSSTGRSSKDAKDDGAMKSASRLATDAKVQENLRKALEEFGKAAAS